MLAMAPCSNNLLEIFLHKFLNSNPQNRFVVMVVMLVSRAKQWQHGQPHVQHAISHAALLPTVAFLHPRHHAHSFQPELVQGHSGCLEMVQFHNYCYSQVHTPATIATNIDERIWRYICHSETNLWFSCWFFKIKLDPLFCSTRKAILRSMLTYSFHPLKHWIVCKYGELHLHDMWMM